MYKIEPRHAIEDDVVDTAILALNSFLSTPATKWDIFAEYNASPRQISNHSQDPDLVYPVYLTPRIIYDRVPGADLTDTYGDRCRRKMLAFSTSSLAQEVMFHVRSGFRTDYYRTSLFGRQQRWLRPVDATNEHLALGYAVPSIWDDPLLAGL